MSKGVYFIFQIIWSIIVASVVWYFYPANGAFDFSFKTDFKEALTSRKQACILSAVLLLI